MDDFVDPHRVLSSGERLSDAKSRLHCHRSARLDAMRDVKRLIRTQFMSQADAEDVVYGSPLYSAENYPAPVRSGHVGKGQVPRSPIVLPSVSIRDVLASGKMGSTG